MTTAAKVKTLTEALEREQDVTPRPTVNDLFSQLVQTVSFAKEKVGAKSRTFKRTQRLCAKGETELERAWAQCVKEASDPGKILAQFPYTENYQKLCAKEWQLVALNSPVLPKRVLFLGSGPLPLSALWLVEQGCHVDAIDREVEACDLSRALVKRLGKETQLSITQADATQIDPSGYDLVILAALVGESIKEKQCIMESLLAKLPSTSLLLVRSAHGWRKHLYPSAPERQVKHGTCCTVFHPVDELVNSILLFRPYAS